MSEAALDAVATAADRDDRPATAAALEAFEAAAVRKRAEERRMSGLAIGVRMAAEAESDPWGRANTYLERVQRVEAARIELQRSGLAYVFELDDGDADAVRKAVATLRERRLERDRAAAALKAARDRVGIPGLLTLLRVTGGPIEVPLGSQHTARLPLTNVGGAAVDDVTLSLDAPVRAVVDPTSLVRLEPDETRELSVMVHGEESGSATLEVNAIPNDGGAGDTSRLTVTVIDRDGYLDRAISGLETAAAIAAEGGTNDGLGRQLTAIVDGLRATRSAGGPGPHRRGSGMGHLRSARRRLSAVGRRLDRGSSVRPPLAAELRPRIMRVDRALEGALTAAEGA